MFIVEKLAFSALIFTPANVRVSEITLDDARREARQAHSAVKSVVHSSLFTAVLGTPVPVSTRNRVVLEAGDVCLLGEYEGRDLPDDATALPRGGTLKWFLVEVDIEE